MICLLISLTQAVVILCILATFIIISYLYGVFTVVFLFVCCLTHDSNLLYSCMHSVKPVFSRTLCIVNFTT